MAVYENFHTQLVIWSKIILPICAIALLSTLFMFARKSGTANDLPIAQIDELAREQQITAPQFSGMTADGSIVELTAKSAKPDQGSLETLKITEPRLTFEAPDGGKVTILAGEGILDNTNQAASLSGLARLETSTGYSMETGGLTAQLDTGEVTSTGPLAIRAPFGAVDAGRVSITVTRDGIGQQLRFTEGVKLVYTPDQVAED
ncbi:lipopolysaccharide export system protein LptC [Cognatiyoonia koreensis]|uniref:Lipopolysaccharide export system protein LptC n=1 Tax=Cognatiyoonia koreensis TaxID=364200 RepID=A0A1I0RM60_9RHOB|nr:LPS export ABC transporter periplasmic protein LptC [Cognatiyoonia koreensis]SEW42330.1 lipopolysaccharide export system protein LptC [Cognatiyoonia koreensis]